MKFLTTAPAAPPLKIHHRIGAMDNSQAYPLRKIDPAFMGNLWLFLILYAKIFQAFILLLSYRQ